MSFTSVLPHIITVLLSCIGSLLTARYTARQETKKIIAENQRKDRDLMSPAYAAMQSALRRYLAHNNGAHRDDTVKAIGEFYPYANPAMQDLCKQLFDWIGKSPCVVFRREIEAVLEQLDNEWLTIVEHTPTKPSRKQRQQVRRRKKDRAQNT